MADAKPVQTPVDPNVKLVKTKEAQDGIDHSLYQSAVGSLLYLATWTRPDIAFAVTNVARYCAKPSKEHWTAVKRIFRYIKGTKDLGIGYCHGLSSDDILGYCDADWAGDVNDRKSTSGYVFHLAGGPISWRSKKQTCVALSTAEAEYVALAAAAQEAVWLKKMISQMGTDQRKAVTIFDDSQSAIAMTRNPQFHGRSKHIDIKYHFIRDLVEEGAVNLVYCTTKEMVADILTKGLCREQHERLKEMMGLV